MQPLSSSTFDYEQEPVDMETITSERTVPSVEIIDMSISDDLDTEVLDNILSQKISAGFPFRLRLSSVSYGEGTINWRHAGSWYWEPGLPSARFDETWGDDGQKRFYRTCRWFTPSQEVVDAIHATIAPSYGYDRPFPSQHKCECPALTAGNPLTMCGFSESQCDCPYYEAEPLTIERSSEMQRVVSTRIGLGVSWAQWIDAAQTPHTIVIDVRGTDEDDPVAQCCERFDEAHGEQHAPLLRPRSSFFRKVIHEPSSTHADRA